MTDMPGSLEISVGVKFQKCFGFHICLQLSISTQTTCLSIRCAHAIMNHVRACAHAYVCANAILNHVYVCAHAIMYHVFVCAHAVINHVYVCAHAVMNHVRVCVLLQKC